MFLDPRYLKWNIFVQWETSKKEFRCPVQPRVVYVDQIKVDSRENMHVIVLLFVLHIYWQISRLNILFILIDKFQGW